MTHNSEIVAAVRALGYADCVITKQHVRSTKEETTDGDWIILSVSRRHGGPYEVWGRRRTGDELLQLAKRGPAY